MPDNPNDVVRHVILRILVDQAGLAEEMAAARTKLKALKDAEKPINDDRAKSADKVTQAVAAQNAELEKNRQAHEASHRAAAGQSTSAVEGLKAQSKQIAANTDAIKGQIREEAQAEAIRTAARQKELDSQRERSASKKKDTDDELRRAEKQQQFEEKGRQDRLRAEASRKAYRDKANESVAGQVIKNQATERNELLKTDALKESLSNREKQRLLSEKAARANAAQLTGAQVDKIQAQAGTEQARTETEQARTTKTQAQTQAVRSGAQNQRAIDRNKADADITRRDENAAAARQRAENLATSNIERQRLESETKIANAQEVHEEKVTTLRQTNQQKLLSQALTDAEKLAATRARTADTEWKASQAQETREERLANLRRTNQAKLGTQALKDIEAISQAQERTRDIRSKVSDAQQRRESITPSFIESAVTKNLADIEISGTKVDIAQSQAQVNAARAQAAEKQAQVAAAKALNEQDRTNVEIGTRRERTEVAIDRAKEDVRKVAAQTLLTEQRAADVEERRNRAGISARRRNTTVLGSAEAMIGTATTGIGTLLFKGPDNTRFDNGIKAMREVQAEGGKARSAVSAFFGAFKSGDREAASVLDHITARVRNFVKALKPASSGGGNLFNNFISNIGDMASAFERGFGQMAKHVVSFQSLVIAVIAAFGPLVAILGAVGAAALGLASNLGALVGVVAALPGILGAAVAGFGALALVMKPITNVFSAYSAAQKESTRTTTAALKATNDLNEARTAAKRKLEDYQNALQKLKFDEEGASLGVEAAKQAYMKALVDPTSTALDVAQAKHAYEGALFDKKQQAVDATRTRQDAALAQSKGIEGSDEVTSVKSSTQAAQEEYQRQIDALPPKTRKVVLAIIELKDQFKKLRETFSDNIFGPLSTETGKFKDVLKILSDFMTPATKAIGEFAKNALDLLTNPEWKRFFSAQGKESAKIIQTLGAALLSAADGFRAVVEAARPFTTFVVDGIKGVAESFDSWANSDKGRKSITDFLAITMSRVKELWPVIKNFAAGFAGFFTALNTPGADGKEDFTTRFNKGLLTISETFRDLGKQAADPNSGFRKWLSDVWPLLQQIGHFIGAVGRFFGNLFSNPDNIKEAESLLKAIADKWLPKLAEIFDKLSQSGLISKLASAIGSIFSGIETFLDHGGLTAIKGFAYVLEGIASTLDWMVQHVPGLSSLLGALAIAFSAALGAGLIYNIIQLIGKFTGLSAVIKGIRNLFTGEFKNNIKNALNPTTTVNVPGSTGGASTTASTVSNAEEIGFLRQIAAYTRQTAINTGGLGAADLDSGGTSSEKKAAKKTATTVEEDVENAAKGKGGIKGFLRRLFGGGAAEVATAAGTTAAGGGIFSAIKKLFTGSKPSASTAATLVEDSAQVATTASKFGKFLKGPAGLAAYLAATLGGDAAINTFVKNDEDKTSLSGALSNISNATGIGSFAGPIGAAAGAVAGTTYSLATDKNLRTFAGDHPILGGALAKPLWGTKSDQKPGLAQSAAEGVAANLALPVVGPLLGALPSGKLGDIGKTILEGLKSAKSGVSDFFTKTIPQVFDKGVSGIKRFFTKTLPSMPGKAFDAVTTEAGRLLYYFTNTLPKAVYRFFHTDLRNFASTGWKALKGVLWDPIVAFIRGIPKFFGTTIPQWFSSVQTWFGKHVLRPVVEFIVGLPDRFSQTVKKWWNEAPEFFDKKIKTPFLDFIKSFPSLLASLPKTIWTAIGQPVVDFFSGLKDHISFSDLWKGSAGELWKWAVGLFDRAQSNMQKGYNEAAAGKMSGGLIQGVYQGIQDTAHIRATPGEFMVRKSKVDQPGAKAFLRDFNDDRIQMSDLYRGLSESARPQVMTMVPPAAQSMTGAVPAVVNNTVNHAPLMGDVTIHNPRPETAEWSLRRRVEIAANRHRR